MDFGGDEQGPTPPPDAGGNGVQREGQYLATAGVGIRIKAYKQSATASNGDLFQPTSTPEIAGPAAETQPIPVAATQPTPVSIVQPSSTPATRAKAAANAGPAARTGPSKRGRKSLKQVTAEADLIEIPADEVLFSKQYYTMGEVSEMFKVNQSLLRYWETEFDILQPRKNKKGDRYFRPVDIKNLHLIYHLLRQKKYTIEGAKDFLRNNKKAKERFEVIERLQQIRSFLLEWKAQL
jgi:DNA-binding transcriptional MerR regulator